MKVFIQATHSALRFIRLVLAGALHLNKTRLWQKYRLNGHGTYAIFRETMCQSPSSANEVTLTVGFRLKLLGDSRMFHWLFQRLCIFTTPFWSGFAGFRVKLWMVDRRTYDYAGIYKWDGKSAAQAYVHSLVKVLTPLSVPDSVWYKIYPEQFETFLSRNRQE